MIDCKITVYQHNFIMISSFFFCLRESKHLLTRSVLFLFNPVDLTSCCKQMTFIYLFTAQVQVPHIQGSKYVYFVNLNDKQCYYLKCRTFLHSCIIAITIARMLEDFARKSRNIPLSNIIVLLRVYCETFRSC